MNKKTAIQSAQLQQLLSVSNVSLITSVTLAMLLAYTQREVVAAIPLLIWITLMVLATFLRAAQIVFYQHAPLQDNGGISGRLVNFRLGVLFAGVVWGAAGFLLFPADNPQHQMFLVVTLLGMTAGGLVSFSTDLKSATLFSVSLVVPVMIRLLFEGGHMYVAMAMAALLYLGFMLLSLQYICRNIYENISLRLDAVSREQIVRESETRYRLLLKYSPVGIFHYDTNLVITFCNERFAEMMNNSIEGIVGLDMHLLNDRAILPALKNAVEGEMGYFEGSYLATYSDADKWVDMICAPSRDGQENIVGGVAIVQDISRRKQAEADLHIAATVFESREGMMVTDKKSRILRVNKAFTRITGYEAEEVIGWTPRMLSSGRQDAYFYAAMWESINNTGSWSGELWNRRKDGKIYPEHISITAVKDAYGNITHYVATFNDISVSKAAADEIRQLAFYDALTRLPNRRLLVDKLRQALVSSARSVRGGALLFIDLDHFKVLNDTLGHDIGDMLLQQVAQRLKFCVREGDTVARLGGDEFVVMLEDLSNDKHEAERQTEIVANKILASLNAAYQLDGHVYRSTPSIGITLFNGNQSALEDLLKQADIAMYQSKRSGRNALRFFNPQMQESINQRAIMETELRNALDNSQFALHYQLQVDSLMRPLGAEALIRWIHPVRGLVSPAEIIPLAEETGLIIPIGLWVLDTACAQLKAWQQNVRTRGLVLAVNVSADQFRQADFVSRVHAFVQTHGIDPMLLKLELTESLLLDNIDEVIATMTALKEVGVQFSLDDFGTGYSSLQYLKRLPFDQVKIEQSFVRDLDMDGSSNAIVSTIISMAYNLNMDVIAEGVETEQQRQLLLEKGCTHFQGYLFGRPVAIEQFEAAL